MKNAPKITQPKAVATSKDAVNFWLSVAMPSLDHGNAGEGFWVIALNDDRTAKSTFHLDTKAFGDHSRFADDLFSNRRLKGIPEIIVIQARRGLSLEPIADDFARVRAVILAGRQKNIPLLDWIICGVPSEKHPSGCNSLYRLKQFSKPDPFAKSLVKTRVRAQKAEGIR